MTMETQKMLEIEAMFACSDVVDEQTCSVDESGNEVPGGLQNGIHIKGDAASEFMYNSQGLSMTQFRGIVGAYVERKISANNVTDDYVREYLNAMKMVEQLGIMDVIMERRAVKKPMVDLFKAINEWSGTSRKVRGIGGRFITVPTVSWIDRLKVPHDQGYLDVLDGLPSREASLFRLNRAVELRDEAEMLNDECRQAFVEYQAKYGDLKNPTTGKIVLAPLPLTREMCHDQVSVRRIYSRLTVAREAKAAIELAEGCTQAQVLAHQAEAVKQYNMQIGLGAAMYLGTCKVYDKYPLIQLPELALALHKGTFLPSLADVPAMLQTVEHQIRKGLRPEDHYDRILESTRYQMWHRVVMGKVFGQNNGNLVGRVEKVIDLLDRKSYSLNRLKGMRTLRKQMLRAGNLQAQLDVCLADWSDWKKENEAEHRECKAIVDQIPKDWPKGAVIVWQLEQRDNEPLTLTEREESGVWTQTASWQDAEDSEFRHLRGRIVKDEEAMAWAPGMFRTLAKACSDKGIDQLFPTIQDLQHNLRDYASDTWGNVEAGTMHEHGVVFIEKPLILKEWQSLQWEKIKAAAKEKRDSDSEAQKVLDVKDQELNQASLNAMVDSVV